MFWIVAASLFLTEPAPLDMPRAEAYLVEEGGNLRLEDRYDRQELWVSQTVVGRWIDDDDRVFLLATLDAAPPAVDANGTVTRRAYAEKRTALPRVRANRKVPRAFREAVSLLSGTSLAEESPRPSRQLPHGFREVSYWQHPTNYSAIVCAFRLEKEETWHLAVWHLAEGDDYVERMQVFEDQFLRREFRALDPSLVRPSAVVPGPERDLLRADVRRSVAAYPNWHFSDTREFAVVDDLPTREPLVALTNEFAAMRARYAAALPTPVDGSNVLSVARLYASRAEYLAALEADGYTNMAWSAAYWSPSRRELVAHLPERGTDGLLRTFRHEAFHQYLSYATSMIPASPWLNEGYAQYFEDDASVDWGEGIELTDENLDRLAAAIPGLLLMDYAQFYDGSDIERRFKYRLAWSVIRFIEKGADEVRLKPFAGLKQRYVETLLETRDMRRATSAAFKGEDLLKKFLSEWKKFWRKPQN